MLFFLLVFFTVFGLSSFLFLFPRILICCRLGFFANKANLWFILRPLNTAKNYIIVNLGQFVSDFKRALPSLRAFTRIYLNKHVLFISCFVAFTYAYFHISTFTCWFYHICLCTIACYLINFVDIVCIFEIKISFFAWDRFEALQVSNGLYYFDLEWSSWSSA